MTFHRTLCFLIFATFSAVAQAAFIVQPDVDGSSSGTAITINSHLTFGNSTSPPSVSTPSAAAGLQPGNSIFGGASPTVDQYIFTYTPGTDADNTTYTLGQNLGNGNSATGAVGGVSGTYKVYATWPTSANISDNGATPTSYVATSDGSPATAGLNQDSDTNGNVGNVWVLIGTVNLTAGTAYTVTQTAPSSAFVSMRSAGVMWELQPISVPEPSSFALVGLCITGLVAWRRRRKSCCGMSILCEPRARSKQV
jgi:hypothetical protein